MSNQSDGVSNTRDEGSADQIARSDAESATSEWFKREGYYAAQAVANAERAAWQRVERRLDKPSRWWTGAEVARTYRTNADGQRRFRDEADVFTPHGYRPWLETYAHGTVSGGLVLIGTSGVELMDDSNGRSGRHRSVSWISEATRSDEDRGRAAAQGPAMGAHR